MSLDHIVALRDIPVAPELFVRQLAGILGADGLEGEEHVRLFVGVPLIADALRERLAVRGDGEGVVLELVAAGAIKVAGVGATDGAGGGARGDVTVVE